MVFKAQVVWYNADDRQNELAGVFLRADSYSEALGKLATYYGEDQINKVSIEPFSPEYIKLLDYKKIPVENMKKLPKPMNLIKVIPESYDLLDSQLKQEGYDIRQHLDL